MAVSPHFNNFEERKRLMENLDRLIQLHEVLEVHYMVTDYEAQLYTHDGHTKVLIARGESVEEAIRNLANKAKERGINDWEDVRKLAVAKPPTINVNEAEG